MYGYGNYGNYHAVQTVTGTLEYVSDPSQFDRFSYPPPQNVQCPPRYNHNSFRGGGGYGHASKFIDMNKPWISQSIRQEIWKKINLSKEVKRTKSAEDVAALQTQAEYVENLIRDAKIDWLAKHPELEHEWLGVLAEEERTKSYFCDVCEKLIGSETEYKVHLSEHATCGIDGCGYTAHQDILEKHIMQQHLTGLFNKIPQGNSPEEIAKWREERRKNFPTREKVMEKAAERAILKERGEVMWLKKEKKRQEERERLMETEESNEPEPVWECNCKARHFVESLRGRGRGRGRGRSFKIPKNIRHQRHCRELELIRERTREKKENRKAFLDQKRKRCDGDKLPDRPVADKKLKVAEIYDDSCSEDEDWRGSLWKFPGTNNLPPFEPTLHKNEDKGEPRIQSEIHVKAENFQVLPIPKFESEQMSSSDDEAPDEIKTVVSYENVEEEDSTIHSNSIPSKKSRKRKKKHVEDLSTVAKNMSADAMSPAPTSSKEEEPPTEGPTDLVSHLDDLFAYMNSGIIDNVPPHESNKPTDHSVGGIEDSGAVHSESTAPRRKPNRPVVFEQKMRPPTLLEKLLLNEIKKERNKILQCVRYVCKNNFFSEKSMENQ